MPLQEEPRVALRSSRAQFTHQKVTAVALLRWLTLCDSVMQKDDSGKTQPSLTMVPVMAANEIADSGFAKSQKHVLIYPGDYLIWSFVFPYEGGR